MATYLQENNTPTYVINLDPAVKNLPFEPNIDIRNTIEYKKVMKQYDNSLWILNTKRYNLGPNGAIMTSLNLFSTRFDQVMKFIDKRAPELKWGNFLW